MFFYLFVSDITDSLLDESDIDVYYGIILVFANISGLITVLPNGKIHSINNNFALMLFGFSQSELIGKVCLVHSLY